MVQMVQTAASLLKISESVNDNVYLPRIIGVRPSDKRDSDMCRA